MDSHERECVEAALAVLLERAIKNGDRREARRLREFIRAMRAEPIT